MSAPAIAGPQIDEQPPSIVATLTAAAAAAARPDQRCAVGRWLGTLDPDVARLVDTSCTPGRVNTVYGNLKADGHPLPCREATWGRHFSGRCGCPPIDDLIA